MTYSQMQWVREFLPGCLLHRKAAFHELREKGSDCYDPFEKRNSSSYYGLPLG